MVCKFELVCAILFSVPHNALATKFTTEKGKSQTSSNPVRATLVLWSAAAPALHKVVGRQTTSLCIGVLWCTTGAPAAWNHSRKRHFGSRKLLLRPRSLELLWQASGPRAPHKTFGRSSACDAPLFYGEHVPVPLRPAFLIDCVQNGQDFNAARRLSPAYTLGPPPPPPETTPARALPECVAICEGRRPSSTYWVENDNSHCTIPNPWRCNAPHAHLACINWPQNNAGDSEG